MMTIGCDLTSWLNGMTFGVIAGMVVTFGLCAVFRAPRPDREPLQVLPRPMHSAPKDGTVILAFIDGTNYPQPVRFAASIVRNRRGVNSHPHAWRMAWDDYELGEADLLGWLPVPTYEGKAVR